MECKFEDLLGKTLDMLIFDNDRVIEFNCTDGSVYRLYHSQHCCESVYVEDVIGDIEDLIGEPLLQAEEVSNDTDPPKDDVDSVYTWTFYKLATNKGRVTIRWFGTSNGYYSTSVDFCKVV